MHAKAVVDTPAVTLGKVEAAEVVHSAHSLLLGLEDVPSSKISVL